MKMGMWWQMATATYAAAAEAPAPRAGAASSWAVARAATFRMLAGQQSAAWLGQHDTRMLLCEPGALCPACTAMQSGALSA